MTERKYARKYLRIRPDPPISGEITVVRVGRDEVKTGKAYVRIVDICPGGLKFTSTLNLPTDGSLCLELRFQVSNADFSLKGYITHKRSTEVREYGYGLCFLEPDEALRVCLKKLFGSMFVEVQNHIVILRGL